MANMAVLRTELHRIREQMLPVIFAIFLEKLTRSISDILVRVIEESQFDSFGATRLSNELASLYDVFSITTRRPENRFFRRLKDCATILCQSSAQVLSLRNALRKLLASWNGDVNSPEGKHIVSMLEDGFEVCTISPNEAFTLTTQRVDVV
jgi:hypothetical protein